MPCSKQQGSARERSNADAQQWREPRLLFSFGKNASFSPCGNCNRMRRAFDWLPSAREIVAKLEIQPDARYTFLYSGTAINALAAAQIKQAGSLNSKDEAGLRAEADKMVKEHDVRKAAYKGSGRYDLEIESQKKPGQPLKMFDIFSVRTEKDGVMTIASSEIKEKGKRELEQLGIVVDGTLEVRVPKNAEVISSNATSTPTLGFGAYSWKIGRIDQRPVLKLRFKPVT